MVPRRLIKIIANNLVFVKKLPFFQNEKNIEQLQILLVFGKTKGLKITHKNCPKHVNWHQIFDKNCHFRSQIENYAKA